MLEHCARAIDRSLGLGEHGLPLMGSGDWNDGMNRVGIEGKGESVWLGWFLCTVLNAFAPLCEESETRPSGRVQSYRRHLEKLKKGLQDAWDGDWYKRAYFDDGTPLGSAQNDECRIDSIAQTWAVMSGVAEPHRAARAMAAVEEYLIRRGDGLIGLFAPPFDKSKLDPGYVKGYVPGVRENGGQYTHAALWTVIAFAVLGDGDRAGHQARADRRGLRAVRPPRGGAGDRVPVGPGRRAGPGADLARDGRWQVRIQELEAVQRARHMRPAV